jgi:hypothetical protein
MIWVAANDSKPEKRKENVHLSRQGCETVEAALSRLTKAYSTAMSCIGLIHKLQHRTNSHGNRDDFKAQSQSLADAARSIFESLIFTDPLIVKYCPTWMRVVHDIMNTIDKNVDRWSFVKQERPNPVVLSSTSHRRTVAEVSYLSLINYADLLLASDHSRAAFPRQVVIKLPLVEFTDGLNPELSLAALCDASDIDRSDPVIWLKIAHCTKSLRGESNEFPPVFMRLERHAIENGITALPPNFPPNRRLNDALKEHENYPDVFCSTLKINEAPSTFLINIPRYSWSTLGRLLIRACREGMSGSSDTLFGSPCVEFHFSPMLLLPQRPLFLICAFIEKKDVWSLEATCRALSAAILSAKASIERAEASKIVDSKKCFMNSNVESSDNTNTLVSEIRNSNPVESAQLEKKRDDNARSRSSKRLLSQLITSGKRSDREFKRKSVPYCLLGCTLHCTLEDDAYQVALSKRTNEIFSVKSNLGKASGLATYTQITLCEVETTDSRLGVSCLASFVNKWSKHNSGPLHVLHGFISHVSLNVSEVFESDFNSLGLCNLFIECYDLVSRMSGFQYGFELWTAGHMDLHGKSEFECLQYLAVNLLHIELRLKRSQTTFVPNVGQDDDHAIVAMSIPILFQNVEEMEQFHLALLQSTSWIRLKVRLHWLATGFFFDKSRLPGNITTSRVAEGCGLKQVELAMHCLSLPEKCPILSIKTPHLASPRRTGCHWKTITIQSLTDFRNDILASSVVSDAREEFIKLLREIRLCKTSNDIPEMLMKRLGSLGANLSARFELMRKEDASRFEDLIDDFISTHDKELHTFLRSGQLEEEMEWHSFWNIVPSGSLNLQSIVEIQNPSILTILTTCLHFRECGTISTIKLLSRIIFCSLEQFCTKRISLNSSKNTFDTEYDDENDDVEDSDEEGFESCNESRRQRNQKDSLNAVATQFFMDKILFAFKNELSNDERRDFAISDDCQALFRSVMKFVSIWYFSQSQSSEVLHHDLYMFQKICSLRDATETVASGASTIDVILLRGCIYSLSNQRKSMRRLLYSDNNDLRSSRSLNQKILSGRAEFISTVLIEVALLLSQNESACKGSILYRSLLIESAMLATDSCYKTESISLASMVSTLLFFWNLVTTSDLVSSGNMAGKVLQESMLVPIGATIIALCGSATCSMNVNTSSRNEFSSTKLNVSEFFDSDASVNSDCSEEIPTESCKEHRGKSCMLQPICLAIYCISSIIDKIDETRAWFYVCKFIGKEKNGFFFPLLASRVLSFFSDILLTEFSNKEPSHDNIWGKTYPYRTRSIGAFLDGMLHKLCYKLYGIALNVNTVEKEKSVEEIKFLRCPESTKAAAQLYRCIQRAYSLSRRSIPKTALECVATALPSIQSSTRRKRMERFIFNGNFKFLSSQIICDLAEDQGNWEQPFQIHLSKDVEFYGEKSEVNLNDEIFIVRQGIARELSLAPLNNISQIVSADECHKTLDDRVSAIFNERELAKKFWAIVDNMAYCDPFDYVGWLRAAECANAKADLIADRLGLSSCSISINKISDFCIPEDKVKLNAKLMSIDKLNDIQESEFHAVDSNWVPFIGEDLSLYVDHQWSSFSSLQKCSALVRKRMAATLQHDVASSFQDSVQYGAFIEIDTMFTTNNFIGWQQAWGGIFVEALRFISLRCICMSYYISRQRRKMLSHEANESLKSEILESLGITMYTKLLGGQGYGFPMRPLSAFEKRGIASAAQKCFHYAAIMAAADSNQLTFDMLFMEGKCFEKIAQTYSKEKYYEQNLEDVIKIRLYEVMMAKAFNAYIKSEKEVTALHKEGALSEVQAGGSSHGRAEVIYRLHASRLKCVIKALQYPDLVREKSLAEAIRLASCTWYDSANACTFENGRDINDVLWKVSIDIVAALAQCRLDNPFFHRSVYRHAQALMWAPALQSPEAGIVAGSNSTLPTSKCRDFRGLSSATSCTVSAEVVLSALFEKRRPQLVSVWVTSPKSSPSPFEVINNYTRKYDSLRKKYLSAYIDTLMHVRKGNALESLYQQMLSTKRDLPSHYQASALVQGDIPDPSHVKECLIGKIGFFQQNSFLTNLKRHINRALACIAIKELPLVGNYDDHLKKCYIYFLRLNCGCDDVVKLMPLRYGSVSIPEVDAVCRSYLRNADERDFLFCTSNWSSNPNKAHLFRQAIKKCEELYPGIAKCLYRKSKIKKIASELIREPGDEESKGQGFGPESESAGEPRDDPSCELALESDESNNEMSLEDKVHHFVVDVPQDMDVGDKFETQINVGGRVKTIRLTVPSGPPTKIKFSLKFLDNEETEASKKRRKGYSNKDRDTLNCT